MRASYNSSPVMLLQLLAWLLAATQSALAQLEAPVEVGDLLLQSNQPSRINQLTNPLRAVKKAPAKIGLGADDFLHSGLKRKSVIGAYSTTAAVSLGGAAIWYQTTNMQSKDREAKTKAEKDKSVKAAICEAQRRHAAEQAANSPPAAVVGVDGPLPPYLLSSISDAAQSEEGNERGGSDSSYAYPPSRVLNTRLKKRVSDAVLNTIEDYNKMIGASEAVASGSIAVTAAHQAQQRSLAASSEFYC